ncbi:hypothetical protein [Thalassovita sp.]|uniref:hypothetical protein n=1 Tax=Thalassovita sp. TaxID=1979401 RepID=UPI002AAFC6F8|nr:hypothetical protein [Thalassovita sp.]
MKNDWILEVLRDLKAYADLNGLDVLAHQLEATEQVALAEILLEASRGIETGRARAGGR